MKPLGKVIIQIPCYNEEKSLPVALAELPRELPGASTVEWLVIDDGSTDGTIDVAKRHGVDHVVRVPVNRGLANAFALGLERCIELGADVIVNTDADNQYCAADIPLLLAPIAQQRAEIVIGARPIAQIERFSWSTRLFQRIGSWVVRAASNTAVSDAPSGFRAITRSAAMRLHIVSDYTYTLEMIIQAGRKGIPVTSVPIRTNADLRPSRLVRSASSYIRMSALTIVRVFMAYQPFRFFAIPGALSLGSGLLISLRFLYLYSGGQGRGHVQSLILSALLIGIGFFLLVVSLLADLISVNRRIQESTAWRVRQIEEKLRRDRDG
jgi:glycosyltransferase involved in cell wall biosynthesis